MSWNETMSRMLPQQGDKVAHVTSGWTRSNGAMHGAVDFNYEGGQTGINLEHPSVYSPVDGTVVQSSGGSVGCFSIRDADGNLHKIIHLDSRQPIAPGTTIHAGDAVGTMGATGSEAQHVHYQIEDPQGQLVDPQSFWNDKDKVSELQKGFTGTLAEAVAEAQRRSPGPVAFVSADWERQARVRALTPEQLTSAAEQARAVLPSAREAVYSLTASGAIHNTVTSRDEFVAVRAGDGVPKPLLDAAAPVLARAQNVALPEIATPARPGPGMPV